MRNAEITSLYQGKEYNWALEYPEDMDDHGICYTLLEGNYSCDCNRSSFMGIKELPCGETIELSELRIDGIVQDLKGWK